MSGFSLEHALDQEREQEFFEPVTERGELRYWMAPVREEDGESATEIIERLIGEEGIFAFGERTPGRKKMKRGDRICFYATTTGIVGHATVQTAPEKSEDDRIRRTDRYPYLVRLAHPKVYPSDPVVIDEGLRRELDAFEGKDPSSHWSWFVFCTRQLTKHDFEVLTRNAPE